MSGGHMASGSMIERVARAMAEASVALQDAEGVQHPTHLTFDDLPERELRWMRAFARAAIEAMREPTEEMVERAFDGPIFQCASRDEIRNGYRAMIREALT